MQIATSRSLSEIKAAYPTLADLSNKFSPQNIVEYTRNPTRCVTGHAPALSQLDATYGRGAATTWLIPQLAVISEYAGVTEKATEMQLTFLAESIANEYYHLNIAEIMLFVSRFSQGRYGIFYGRFDPMRVMAALPAFMRERAELITKHQREQEAAEREQMYNNAVTREEYDALVKRAAAGDPDATAKLQPPTNNSQQ